MINNFKKRLVIGLILIALVMPTIGVKAVLPVVVTGDVTATAIATKSWISEAWTYLRNKVATIFFQNLLRKVLNDFASDAAKYAAAGGKGQQALYVKEKWGNFWENVGDKAAGDFIESFANSVISDIAANEIRNEGATLCDRQKEECMARAGTDAEAQKKCEDAYPVCLDQHGNENVGYELCKQTNDTCKLSCANPGPSSPDCLNSCETIYLNCAATTGGTLGAQRRAPMFKASNSPLAKINICNPRLEVGLMISLGLTSTYTGWEANCKFSKMVQNWTNEYQRIKDISSNDFLARLSTMFQPTGSDLGATFTIYSNLIEYRQKEILNKQIELPANNGYTDDRDIAGDLKGVPGQAESLKKLTDQALIDNIGKVTGDIIVDASNIFLNQLAMSLWQNLTSNLTSEVNRGSLSYYSGSLVGRKVLQNRLDKMTEPVFSDGGKLDVLSGLVACSDPEKPGPSNCVITSQFSDAISNKMSVIDAVKSGRLPADWPFGFNKNGEDKISFNQGYPYRSIIILRKYRILPVGWELAAQEIQRKYLNNEFNTDAPNGITLGDLLACYSSEDDLKGYDSEWCRGLIDPNWLLKVPEYYCARKGYGPQLLKEPDLVNTGLKYCSTDNGATMTAVEGKQKPCESDQDCCSIAEATRLAKYQQDGNIKQALNFTCGATCSYEEQKLSVYRDDTYCADEQGCIKEGRNGSCLFYGYCTEERRKWVFNKDNRDESCDPMFNTCQNFRASDGQRLAYLANTLDYNCNQSSVGCKEYSYGGQYNAGADTVAWDPAQSIYFNKKVGSCANKQEGCHEFIRVRDGKNINLLADSGFEANDTARWSNFGSVVSKTGDVNNFVYGGGYSLHVPVGVKGVYYNQSNKSLLPDGFEFEANRYYSLTALVYIISGKVEMVMGKEGEDDSQAGVLAENTGVWQEMSLTFFNDSDNRADFFAIRPFGTADFYLDNIKFEIGESTAYSAYGANSLVYEKLLPAYMEKACYNNPPSDYNFKEDAPAKCHEFARKCLKEEVGCDLYTETSTKDTTAAQVKPTDYCPAECVGYDAFIQKANNFYSAKDEYFIPKTAKTCSARSVGCGLFVNLDKLKEGGEEDEYFSRLRRCIKPDDTCGEFYTWEGSDESGYQLVVYQLKENNQAGISQPEVVDDENPNDTNDGEICDEVTYGLPHDSPDYNPDCRQFYGRDGNVSYHLISKTITCSNSCYPYRLVENNVDVAINSLADCQKVAYENGAWRYGFWDEEKQECIRCLNGSEWQDQHRACVFMADPDKSQTCGASEVGCAEYEGNFSNNVRVIFNSTFENNNLDGWGQTVKISSEALSVGGHSIQITAVNNNTKGWFEKNIKGRLKANKRYVLSFVAKKKIDKAEISGIHLGSSTGTGKISWDFADNVQLTNDWRLYKFDLASLSEADLQEITKLEINTNGQSDSIRLDNIKLLEMSDTHYLVKDSWKTPESCDQDQGGNPAPLFMLGCKEYRNRDNRVYNLKSFDKLCQESAVGCELMIDTFNSSFYGKETFNDIVVPADKFAYIVYEKNKECRSSDKGCSRLGLNNSLKTAYKDVYLLNDPNRYDDLLCTKDQVGCEAWGTETGGEVYFKEPGLRACEFKQATDGSYGWYKIKSKHCCNSDGSDCALDTCSQNSDCEASKACLEVDSNEPCMTSFNKTIGLGSPSDKIQPIGMAEDIKGNAGLCPVNQNGCTEYIDPESRISYNLIAKSAGQVDLKTDTLYIIKAGSVGACQGLTLYRLDGSNNLVASASVSAGAGLSEEFYIDSNGSPTTVTCTVAGAELKEAIVNYRLASSINQEKPTDVDFVLGQVLFNVRSFDGGKYNSLIYNTNKSQSGQPTSAKPDEDNANNLLKVDPDRECAKWLGCKSYIENPSKAGDKICYERGLCDRMNEAGECVNFLSAGLDTQGRPTNQTYSNKISDIASLSGYSKVGYEKNLLNADLYNLANMVQEGEARVKTNGSFENTFNSGFKVVGDPDSLATVISDAKILEKELGFGSYKLIPDGRAVAKTNKCVTKTIDNVGGRYYVASAYVFVRYGSNPVNLTIGDPDNTICPLESVNDVSTKNCQSGQKWGTVASTNVVGRWVRLVGKFSLANNYQAGGERKSKVTVGICGGDDMIYFDDVRIEPGLKEKDTTYLHSDCRLYPERDAMGCDYYDASGLRKKGWSGYCLEYDPKNFGSCLLWYPIDKVESEEYEEGVAISIAKDLYYCIDAEDQCNMDNKTEPEFYCKKFIKVNKDSYWYDRITSGSNYFIPYKLLDPDASDSSSFYADFGINAGGKTDPIVINQKAGSGFYGAYSPGFDLNGYDEKATIGNSGKKLLPFVPFFGWSYGGMPEGTNSRKDHLCLASLDNNGHDQPWEVSEDDSCGASNEQIFKDANGNIPKYDNCYVRGAVDWDDIDDFEGLNKVCAKWDYLADSGYGLCTELNGDENNWNDGVNVWRNYKKIISGRYYAYFKEVGRNTCCGLLCNCDRTVRDEDGVEREIPDVKCSTSCNEEGICKGKTTDACDDNDDAGCFFDCFDHTKFYRVAKGSGPSDSFGISRAREAVKRLFTKSDQCLTWNGSFYAEADCGGNTIISPSGKCANNQRPKDENYNPNNPNVDYCYVEPQVGVVKLNDNLMNDAGTHYTLKGRGWIILRFTSSVDAQQLPLRKYKVNWGYSKAGINVNMVRNVNMYSRPDISNPHMVYYFLDINDMDICSSGGANCPSGATKCCAIIPSVEITDNWGKFNQSGGRLDKPLIIWE